MSKEEGMKLLKFIALSVAGIFLALLLLHVIDAVMINPKNHPILTDDNVYEFVEPGDNYTEPFTVEIDKNLCYQFHVEYLDDEYDMHDVRYVLTGGENDEEIGGYTFDLPTKGTELDMELNFHVGKTLTSFTSGTIGDTSYRGNVASRVTYETFPENAKIAFTGRSVRISQLSLSGRTNSIPQLVLNAVGWIFYIIIGYFMIALMFLAPAYFADDSFTDPILYNFEATLLAIAAFLITSFLAVQFAPWLWSLINVFTESLYGYHLTLIKNLVGGSFWAIPVLVVSIIAGIIMIILQQCDVDSQGRLYAFLAMLLGGFVRLLSIGFMAAVIISLLDTIIQMAIVIGFFALIAVLGSSGAGGGATSSSGSDYPFAGRYSSASAGHGDEFVVVTKNNNNGNPYAVLRDSHGNNVSVRPVNPNSSNGILKDDAGNTYYPR